MAQTVVGFFDDAAQAQRAVQQLVSNGFDRDRIDVSSGNNRGSVSTSSTDHDSDHENGITRFFKNLFGDDNDEADRYSRVGLRSNSIVTVHAQSSDEAERAADLLDDYGAINVNERASEYESTGSSSSYDRTNVSSTGLDTDYDRASATGTGANATGTDYDRPGSDTGYDRTSVGSDYDRTDSYSDSDTRHSNLNNDIDRTSDRDTTINRIEENLEVGKRTVETGGVRVRSRIVEKPVEESIRLREERVNVERNPVDRAATRDELANFEERDIELTERAEVPVVNKEARVVEEIRVSKDVDEREETIRDTVRRTDVDVENLGGSDRSGSTDLDTDYNNRNTRID